VSVESGEAQPAARRQGGDLQLRGARRRPRQYGLNGTLAGIGIGIGIGIGTGQAQDVVGSAQFGTQAQQLRPLATLQEGPVRLT
jgi:hypothetical protein